MEESRHEGAEEELSINSAAAPGAGCGGAAASPWAIANSPAVTGPQPAPTTLKAVISVLYRWALYFTALT